MMTTQIAMAPPDLERGMEWERAAKLLDLSPEMLRRIRFPRFECVSHHESLRGNGGALHIASGPPSCEGAIACVRVGPDVTSSKIAADWQESRLSAALAGNASCCAAIGLDLVEPATAEHELWQLAEDCAPVIARTLGEVTLLAQDLASAAVAGWIAHSSARFGSRIRMPNVTPAEYCLEADRLRARTMLHFASLALQDRGKVLGHCGVGVVGTGPLASECLERLRQSGAKVIALADESGSLLDPDGIDLAPVLRHVEESGLLVEYKEGKHALHAATLSAGADLLLLCSSAMEISEANSGSVRPGTVVIDGGAYGVTCGAAEELSRREVLVVPARAVHSTEFAAESFFGGYKEFFENKDEQCRTFVAGTWERIRKLRNLHGLSVPDAAILLAVGRLAEWERNTRP